MFADREGVRAAFASIGKCAGFAANGGCVVGVGSARVEATEAHDAFPERAVRRGGWIGGSLEQVSNLVRHGLGEKIVKVGRGEDEVEVELVGPGRRASSLTAERKSNDDRVGIDFDVETVVVESDRLQGASGDERAEFGLSHWTPPERHGGQP